MAKLSIIIVNYNVKHFLEQCLISVFNAIQNIRAEVFVVDNNSVDGSCTMIKERFTKVHLIENKNNYGFSYANNQAIKKSSGEYILLLNPDTLVEEDSFEKCIRFMDAHEDAGGMTVRMIDGKGNFLPESKRALPTPLVSFYKIFGFTRLFPKSKRFARYYLGHLSEKETHSIEILPGAFMFLRKETLEKTGLLDESYFMYGEDIDLSYRILKSEYKNYYSPQTTIIHYKGESTKKGSINYVYVFYRAMIIFAQKHFSKKNAKIFSIFINLAIYFRAFLAILSRFVRNMFLPALDFMLIFLAYYAFEPIWEAYKFRGSAQYPEEFLKYAVPSYIIIWLTSLWFNGGYSKQIKTTHLLKGIGVGTIIILVIYGLLPENLRFSRVLILSGTVFAFCITLLNRLLVHQIKIIPQKFKLNRKLKIVTIGQELEVKRVISMIDKAEIKPHIIGSVSPTDSIKSENYIGTIDQLDEIIKVNNVDEIVFCAKDIPSNQIISTMLRLSGSNLNFKIAQPDTLSIIGSNSIETTGELYTVEINSINSSENIRKKRLFDITFAIVAIILSPFLLLFFKIPLNLINNSVHVLLGNKTWIGYAEEHTGGGQLPKIKTGILTPLDKGTEKEYSQSYIQNMNLTYAKSYSVMNDLHIILQGFKHLGR